VPRLSVQLLDDCWDGDCHSSLWPEAASISDDGVAGQARGLRKRHGRDRVCCSRRCQPRCKQDRQ
jgi:hypothetical protein